MSRYGTSVNKSSKAPPRVEVKLGKNKPSNKLSETYVKKQEARFFNTEPSQRPNNDPIRLHEAWDFAQGYVSSDDDPNCITVDMLEEANHRVYFGFFHLDWLNQERGFARHRQAASRTYDDIDSRSYMNLSTIGRGGANSSLRGFGSGTQTRRFLDNSIEASGRGYSRGARTVQVDQSFANTEFPHVCSLYHHPNTDTSIGYPSRHKCLTSKASWLWRHA